jgi:competence protein ComEC
MQKSYTYWRAAHPLVFICCHLIVGIYIAKSVQVLQLVLSATLSFYLLIVELILLWAISRLQLNPILKGLFVFLCLISWGCILQLNAVTFSQIKMPIVFEKYIGFCRHALIEKINKNILSKEANGFALALLIGVKSDINKELLNAYTQLGIIHIIAISGMHLDVLFKALTKLTSQLPTSKNFKLLELILLLFVAWTYTFMANASPSILRATLFFSMYLMGKYFALSFFTLNSIAAGILVLVLTNAHGITHIGMQLSYAAVIGIHLFYQVLYKSLAIDNPLIQFLWSNCCMSLAAQLSTFPILILYFNRVASWVLVSNFIMVPLSNFILYGLGFVLILPQSIAIYCGKLVTLYIQFFNQLVQDWFTNTKASTLQISMNPLQILMYYLLLLFMYLWIYQKKPTYLLLSLGIISGYSVIKLFS